MEKLRWRLTTTVHLLCSTFILLHALVPYVPDGGGLWGANYFRDLSKPIFVLLITLWCVCAIPPLGRLFLDLKVRFSIATSHIWERSPSWKFLAAIVSFFAFWILGAYRVYGDGTSIASNIEHGYWFDVKNPLYRGINVALHQLISLFRTWHGDWTLSLVSCLAGVIYIYIVIETAAELGNDVKQRWIAFGILISPGYMQLFFGHIENYALSTALLSLALYSSIKFMRGAATPFSLGLAYSLAVTAHLSAVWILPGFVYLVCKNTDKLNKKALFQLIIGASIPLLLCLVFFFLGHQKLKTGFIDELGGDDASMFVPLARLDSPKEHYTLFSSDHIIAMINEHLLIGGILLPLAVILIILRFKQLVKDRVFIFLALTSLGYLAYSILFNPDLGPFWDWDMFAASALPYTFLCAHILSRHLNIHEAQTIAPAIIISGIVHWLGFVLFNNLNFEPIREQQMEDILRRFKLPNQH